MKLSLAAVNVYVQAGIGFVPVPVLNDEDNNNLVALADEKLSKILKEIEDSEET